MNNIAIATLHRELQAKKKSLEDHNTLISDLERQAADARTELIYLRANIASLEQAMAVLTPFVEKKQ